MAKIEIPFIDRPPETDIDAKAETLADVLLSRLDDGGVVRYEELVEHDTLQVRQTLDRLEINGAVERFAVGEHIMVKLLVDDIGEVAV
jgi:hypothetical protein